ncbi:ATP-binding protein [Streptomyces sp. BPTC-684]|uniref:ATP-binding protein n=1 Tax=Streptomyces sp. BPTC-684 TaxID=3043734 RepID=UPI0024B16719|nr:ATP-binding protein [Streptomyces sp. BPTC-684]WHM36568.1 ATP-binding protein [Streptomyces sp. BPTC-684]
MNPMDTRGPDDFDHEQDGPGTGAAAPRKERDRDAVTPEIGARAAGLARTVQLVSGDFLLTVNPVDGSEIEPCPPGEIPGRPERQSAAERADRERALRPPVPAGPAAPAPVLLERGEERERLVRLLGRGRSVRLTGPAGSGRTVLLDAVAADCAQLAPDGVVRLSGHRRTPQELLHELYATVYRAPLHRPDRAGLLDQVREIGAVVLVDDLEFGGAALEELLAAAPECAFLLAATPEVAAPPAESHLEEVFLTGLGRSASLELLEQAVDRPLSDEEANWAGDLWFESEGLPLRFVEAGALLRQRDGLRGEGVPRDEFGLPVDEPSDVSVFSAEGREVPLPSLGEGAAPAAPLAARLGQAARETLRFAVALGGEVPHQAHLPALVGDTHADAALGELLGCGLLSPVGTRYRLAAGVLTQLEAAGYGEDAGERAHTAAQHYAWWTGHPSVTPERAAAEADAVLAALGALVPGGDPGHPATAVKLARSAAPAFAAGLHWGAWERALRIGSAAARLTGEVAEEAYFHHELGVLALCAGNVDRARAELEASIGLKGALSDKRGTVAGRRALALVEDRSGGPVVSGGRTPSGDEVPAARYEESQSPPAGVPAPPDTTPTVLIPGGVSPAKRTLFTGTRRNLVAAGAGAVLAAVLGTVVTLGATSGSDAPDKVEQRQSANEDATDPGLPADTPTPGAPSHGSGAGSTTPTPSRPGVPGTTPSSASSPGTTPSGEAPTPSGRPSGPSTSPGGPKPSSPGHASPTPKPSATKSSSPTPTPTPTPPTPTSPSPTPTESTPTTTGGSSSGTPPSNSASGPTTQSPASSPTA